MWIIVVSLAADIFLAYQFYGVAVEKGYNSIKYFLIPVFFVLFGYLLIIALPDRGMDAPNGNGIEQGYTGRSQIGNAENKSPDYSDLPEL